MRAAVAGRLTLGSPVRPTLWVLSVAAAAYAVAGWLNWGGTSLGLWVGTVLLCGLPPIGGLWAIARARRWSGRAQVSWTLLGVGAIAWSAGNTAYAWYEVVREVSPPFPGPPDAGYLLALLLLSAGALALPAAPRRRWSLVRAALDAGLVSSATLLVSWVLIIHGIYQAGGFSFWQKVFALAYPIGDVLVLSVLLIALRRTTLGGRPSLALLLLGMVLLVVADSGYMLMTEAGTYGTGAPSDVGWWAGLFLVGPACAAYRDDPVLEDSPTLRPWAVLIPYLSTVTAVALFAVSWVLGRHIDAVSWALVLTLVVLMLARQSAVTLDSISLASEVQAREDDLRFYAFHDALTQLPNRRWFRDEVTSRIRHGQPAAGVLFVDLDGFKMVNDTYGHDVGDALLRDWAGRLRAVVRESHVVARLGGDEFAVLVDYGFSTAEVAERICLAARAPFLLSAVVSPVNLTASVGIAPWDSGATPEEMLRNADLAMYRAKSAGRNQVGLYERHLHDLARRRLETEIGLRAALDSSAFELRYQPVIDLALGRVAGAEALLRWRRDGQLDGPVEFISVAEETGLIVPLGQWVLDRACTDLADWRERGLPEVALSINVATAQLRDPDFPELVGAVLQRRRIPPQLLTVEITERVLLDDNPQVVLGLRRLHELGVALALDDFGTGYGSLSSLRVLPASVLKIDRTFVAEFGRRGEQLVRGLAALGRHLGLTTVAEGIETAEQLEVVRAAGVPYGQGFFFARPMTAQAMVDFVTGPVPTVGSLPR